MQSIKGIKIKGNDRELLNGKEQFLLYAVFICQTLGRMVEPFGLLLWVFAMGKIGNIFMSLSKVSGVLVYILLVSLLGYVITGFPINHFVEQILQLGYYLAIYYSMMVHFKGRYNAVFSIYVNVAFWLAIAGVIQYVLGRFLGIPFLFSVSGREVDIGDLMRARAWMGESSYLAMYILPAIVYNSLKKGVENYKSIILIVAGLLTFSPVYQMMLLLFMLYYVIVMKHSAQRILLYSCAILGFYVVSSNFEFSEYDQDNTKRNETIEYWGADFAKLESANLSTYAFLKNIKIATMADNRITGAGIGSHGYSHDKFYHSNWQYSILNKEDAFSLATRIFSEFGIVGIGLFLFFLMRGYNKKDLLNIACLFYIAYALCRGGHYSIFGVQFFIMLFYFTSKFKVKY